ncbi:hypothetical protein MIND_01331000 [Mycena indigotica]|uniref:Cell wall galactomannoprotein n=1 Tax=Mycena indigotica TaxID=2126181 RepID=A0A8H6VSA4_9AGAR|nr:uncharacterized protein MIND_01331000 [Mycena indigotica]KAF7290176.1 hypothetical protein MIND_01331000 [Mycena indigotica]
MAPFVAFFVSFALALAAGSAPTPSKRQIGNLQCNLARLTIINSVTTAKDLITSMQQANSTIKDIPTNSAFSVAQTGLTGVQAAIQDILDAVLVDDPAPEVTRGEVVGGIEAALTALKSAQGTMKDGSLNATLSKTLDVVNKSRKDAKNVIVNCTVPATGRDE